MEIDQSKRIVIKPVKIEGGTAVLEVKFYDISTKKPKLLRATELSLEKGDSASFDLKRRFMIESEVL